VAKTLTGNLNVTTSWDHRSTDSFATSKEIKQFKILEQVWTNGTGQNQINKIYRERRCVTLSTTTDDIDLAGVLIDIYGDTISFTHIKEIVILNTAIVSGEDLLIGGAAANAWSQPFNGSATAKDDLWASGIWVRSAPLSGIPVTAGSSDTLRITHNGSADDIDYDIVIKGVE